MTGPVGTMFGVMLNAMGAQNETALFLTEAQKRDLLRGLFDAYYRPQADKAVIFDTNRAWTARLPALLDLYPEAKLLCCVRDVAWVMDSIERLVRRNAFEPSRLFGSAEERATVFSRVEALAHRDRLVGFAWSALKEAYYGEHSRAAPADRVRHPVPAAARHASAGLRVPGRALARARFRSGRVCRARVRRPAGDPGPAHGQGQGRLHAQAHRPAARPVREICQPRLLARPERLRCLPHHRPGERLPRPIDPAAGGRRTAGIERPDFQPQRAEPEAGPGRAPTSATGRCSAARSHRHRQHGLDCHSASPSPVVGGRRAARRRASMSMTVPMFRPTLLFVC